MTEAPRRNVAPVHVVTDDGILARPDVLETATAIMEAGGSNLAFHLRGHGTTGRRIEDLGRSLAPVARAAGALLLVNDRVDVALALNAERSDRPREADAVGAHLGARSLTPVQARELLGPRPWIGFSAHDPDDVDENVWPGGADYLFVGTIFPSASHPERDAAGTALLRRFVAEVPNPPLRIAIGGVTPERVHEVREAGADGVAAIRAVWGSEDPARAAERLVDAWAG